MFKKQLRFYKIEVFDSVISGTILEQLALSLSEAGK